MQGGKQRGLYNENFDDWNGGYSYWLSCLWRRLSGRGFRLIFVEKKNHRGPNCRPISEKIAPVDKAFRRDSPKLKISPAQAKLTRFAEEVVGINDR